MISLAGKVGFGGKLEAQVNVRNLKIIASQAQIFSERQKFEKYC
jgi:hypothetical protein